MSNQHSGTSKGVFDAAFRYKPSFETDIRKTFDRLRRERTAASREAANPLPDDAESLEVRKEVK